MQNAAASDQSEIILLFIQQNRRCGPKPDANYTGNTVLKWCPGPSAPVPGGLAKPRQAGWLALPGAPGELPTRPWEQSHRAPLMTLPGSHANVSRSQNCRPLFISKLGPLEQVRGRSEPDLRRPCLQCQLQLRGQLPSRSRNTPPGSGSGPPPVTPVTGLGLCCCEQGGHGPLLTLFPGGGVPSCLAWEEGAVTLQSPSLHTVSPTAELQGGEGHVSPTPCQGS